MHVERQTTLQVVSWRSAGGKISIKCISRTFGRKVYVVEGLCEKTKRMMLNATVSKSCKMCTLNCEGFDKNYNYIQCILTKIKPDLLCLYELWLLDENCDKINCIHGGYLSTGKSGVETTRHILQGRPPGRVAIMFRKSMHVSIKPLDVDDMRIYVQCRLMVTIM